MHLILASDHLSMRICDDYSDFKGAIMSSKELFDPPEQSNNENVDTHPYVYSQNIWQGADVKVILLWQGCLLQRVCYIIRKMILLFPAASVIRSSNKQANSLGRHRDEQHEQYRLLNTRVLHCRHDCAHRTRVWMRLPPPWALTRPHWYKIHSGNTHRMGHRIRAACLRWQPCQPVILCCIMAVWVH